MTVYGDEGWESKTQSMAMNWRGYLIAGHAKETDGDSKGFVIATDQSGNPRWSRRYGWDNSTDHLHSVLPVSFLSEHSLLAGNSNNAMGSGLGDGWLTRVDGNGEVLWSRLWGSHSDDAFWDMAPTSDGNFLAVGNTGSFSLKQACWLAKFSPDGERIWERIYSSDATTLCRFVTEIVDPTEPGGKALLMLGHRVWEPYRDVVVFKLKTDGEVKWQRRIRGQYKFSGGVGAQILGPSNTPRGFIIGGTGPHYDEGMVVRLNDDGDLDWAKVYFGEPGYTEGEIHTMVRAPSGAFVYGGFTRSVETNHDAWIFATDEHGELLWSRSYGGWQGQEILSGVSSLGVIPGLGLYAAGWSPSWSDNHDPWAFVMDEHGRIPACSMVRSRPTRPEDVEVIVEDPGMVSQEVESSIVDVTRLPNPGWSDKYMKLCPLDCLYKVDEKSTAAGPDGTTWETAFSSLQDGIEIAAAEAPWSTQGRCEVWVAEGKYHAYQTSAEDTFNLAYKVHMYGGFPGEESGYSDFFDDREWEDYQTILTGYEEGGTERVYHVVTGLPGADDSVLDGFYVRDGLAVGDGPGQGDGGGMFLWDISPAIRNCEFSNNYAGNWGGAVMAWGGAPLFQDVRFEKNGYVVLSGQEQRTTLGGGVFNIDSSAVYRRCSFSGNRAFSLGGAMATAMFDPAATAPMVLDSTFTMNEAQAGGAIITYNAPATTDPLAAQFHVNLLVHGNRSTGLGFGGQTLDGSIVTWGAGQSPSFVHCTVADNVGALLTGGLQAVESNPIIVNSIFWNDLALGQKEIIHPTPADMWVVHSDIQGGWSGSGWGNKNSDPKFTIDWYDLQSDSPCIDSGFDLSPYTLLQEFFDHDLDGNMRPVTLVGPEQYDMGCYELQTLGD